MSNPKTYIVVWNDLNETSFLINLLFDEWVNKSWNHPIEVSQPPKHTWLDEMDLINKSTAAFLPFLCQSRPQLFATTEWLESLSHASEREELLLSLLIYIQSWAESEVSWKHRAYCDHDRLYFEQKFSAEEKAGWNYSSTSGSIYHLQGNSQVNLFRFSWYFLPVCFYPKATLISSQ